MHNLSVHAVSLVSLCDLCIQGPVQLVRYCGAMRIPHFANIFVSERWKYMRQGNRPLPPLDQLKSSLTVGFQGNSDTREATAGGVLGKGGQGDRTQE